jgi:hypothetical protein
MKTEGVTEEQAKAFHSRPWNLHIDSQRNTTTNSGNKAHSLDLLLRDSDQVKTLTPKQRLSSLKNALDPEW